MPDPAVSSTTTGTGGAEGCPTESALVAFREGRLAGAERVAVESHLARCPGCARTTEVGLAQTLLASSGPTARRGPSAAPGLPGEDAGLEPGVRVERYDIRGRIGAGAMGTVYEAYDPDLDRLVALKILKTDASLGAAGEELRQRLLREARAMARLSHPNVVAVYDVGTFGNELFIAMELVRGRTLRGWLSERPRSVREILAAYSSAGAGLAAAHDAGLVHRDFKPDNVLVAEDGRVRVTDFGLARAQVDGGDGPVVVTSRPLLDSAPSDKLTQSGAVVGTPAYMSPEQFGGGVTDARSDIFAFSVALYESLSGARPFEGATLIELITSTRAGRVREAPRGTRVPAAVRRALLRGLGVSREERPASMHEMLALLARAERASRAWKWGGAVGALVVVACVAAVFVARTHKGRIAGAAGRRPVVAVIDFRPSSGDAAHDDAWLGSALARTVAAEMAAGEKARVMSPDDLAGRGVAGSTDGKELDPAAAARARDALGAGYVVTGTYETEGDLAARRVRVDAHVVDTSTGRTISQARQKGTLAEIRDLSLAVADDLGEGLGLRELSGEERAAVRAALPSNPEAMHLYTDALDHARAFDSLGARGLFEKAVAIEPGAPMPHAALARALTELGYGDLARREAGIALEHSGELARADRLSNEALVHELASEWDKAAEIERSLFTFFPDDIEYGLRLVNALLRAGKTADARSTLDGLRGLATATSDRVRVALVEARTWRYLDEPQRCVAAAKEAAQGAETIHSPDLRAQALQIEGVGLGKLDDSAAAIAAETEATQLFAAAGDRGRAALAQEVIGEHLADKGDIEGAQKLIEDSLVTLREIGELHAATGGLGDLVILEKRREHYAKARERAEETQKLLFTESPQERAVTSHNFAELLFLLGDLPAARAKNDEALLLRRTASDRRGIAFSLSQQAMIQLAQGDLPGASAAIDEANGIELKEEKVRGALATQVGWLALERGHGHVETAIAGVTAACDAQHAGRRFGDETACRALEARLLLAAGKRAEAIAALDAASPLLVGESDFRAARLLGVEDAYIRGMVGAADRRGDSIKRLDALVARAHDVGCIGDELDARLARSLVEIADGRAPRESLASIAKDAKAHGFLLVAAHATARRR